MIKVLFLERATYVVMSFTWFNLTSRLRSSKCVLCEDGGNGSFMYEIPGALYSRILIALYNYYQYGKHSDFIHFTTPLFTLFYSKFGLSNKIVQKFIQNCNTSLPANPTFISIDIEIRRCSNDFLLIFKCQKNGFQILCSLGLL